MELRTLHAHRSYGDEAASCELDARPFRCRYLSEKLLSVLGAAFTASSRVLMEATHAYRATSSAAWEQHTAQHPDVADLPHIQVAAGHRPVPCSDAHCCRAKRQETVCRLAAEQPG